jgi:glycosyltransferase involved in cell wall biosynthesis
MIWLSSFPRSGNTFFRNLLFEVYGLDSSSFYDNVGEPENYTDFPFVKTHLLPQEVIPNDEDIKSVYLVRDGRDALVSMAYQQIQIYESKRPFREIFIEATLAAEGSYFGGWTNNVEEWLKRTDVLIRFEDLIVEPLKQVDRLSSIIELPPKNEDKLPSFEDLKFGKPKYGRGKRHASSEEEELEIVQKSFRRGKAFGWKDELDRELQNLFWTYHRGTMEKLGYDRHGGLHPFNPDFDYEIMDLLGLKREESTDKFTVLIEANKLLMHRNDGVKRYLLELLKALYPVTQNENSRWKIDVFLRGRIYPLSEFGSSLFDVNKNENHYSVNEKKNLVYYLKATWSFIKSLVPIPTKDYIKNLYRQILIKIGLKLSGNTSRLFFLKDRLGLIKSSSRSDSESSNLKNQIKGYDLVHVPLPQHYEPFKNIDANFLVTIHDLTHRLFSEYHTPNNVEKAENGLNYFIEQDADFLCISESTKTDLIKFCNVDEEKLYTVLEAADNQKFKPDYFSRTGKNTRQVYSIPDKPYLFTLSTLEPRKNLINTIKAFDLLLDENPDIDCNLVIGGKNGWKSKELMQLRHKTNIIFTNFVDENDLPDLYREAEALCYVSYYEGFGLPPLEAMSCKTPVIYGNNSSMKELFEGYALPANPDDIEDIKEQMKKVLTDSDLKKELEEKGLERSFDFSWRKTAMETLKAYEKSILKKRTNNG